MKGIIKTILCIVILPYFSMTQNIIWSNDIKIKTGSQGSNARPRIIALSDQKGIIIWGHEHDGSISYALWDGEIVSAPKMLDIDGKKAFVTDWASTEIAGKKNVVYIVFKENPAEPGKIYLLRSTDYGVSFSKPKAIVDPIGFYCRFPGVTIDDQLNPIVSYMRFKTDWSGAEYVSMRSQDQGESFAAYIELVNPLIGEACDCCPVNMECDGDRVAIIFRNNRNNIRNMAVALSTDLGESYSQFAELDTANWFLQSCPASGGDAFFNDSLIHTCWFTGRKTPAKVYYSRFNINQNKVDQVYAMNHTAGRNLQQNFPRITGSKDSVFMVWQELTNTNDIFFTYSFANPSELVPNTQRLNVDIAGVQANPDVAFFNQIIYTCWQDDADVTVRFKKGKINVISRLDDSYSFRSQWNINQGIFTGTFDESISQWTLVDAQGKIMEEGKNNTVITFSIPAIKQFYYLRLVTANNHLKVIPIGLQ